MGIGESLWNWTYELQFRLISHIYSCAASSCCVQIDSGIPNRQRDSRRVEGQVWQHLITLHITHHQEDPTMAPLPPMTEKSHIVTTAPLQPSILSILSSCITVCFGNVTAADHKALQKVVKTSQYNITINIPFTFHTITLLPSSRHYSSLLSRRLKKTFFHESVNQCIWRHQVTLQTVQKITDALIQVWEAILQDIIHHLIGRMLKCCWECILWCLKVCEFVSGESMWMICVLRVVVLLHDPPSLDLLIQFMNRCPDIVL